MVLFEHAIKKMVELCVRWWKGGVLLLFIKLEFGLNADPRRTRPSSSTEPSIGEGRVAFGMNESMESISDIPYVTTETTTYLRHLQLWGRKAFGHPVVLRPATLSKFSAQTKVNQLDVVIGQ